MEDSERRKAIELLKEMRTEKKGEDDKSSNKETRLNWMYKGPSDLVDKEEYLLGKAIDRSFEVLNSGGSTDAVGRTGEQSNVPKKLLEKTESTEQVDIAKKILEDPLYAIKQKEMEARKKLLNNPVKLKQIKQMLMERSKQNKAKKKKKSKKKSEQELNHLILKKLKKFTDKEKRKALNKIMKSDTESSSNDSSSSDNKEDKKHKHKRKQSSSSSEESDSSSETSSSFDESDKRRGHKNKKRKHKHIKKIYNKKEKSYSSDAESSDSHTSVSDSSDSERHKKTKNRKSKNEKSSREESSKTQAKFKYSNIKTEKRDSGQRNRRDRTAEKDENRRKVRRDDSSDEDRKSKKNYGLMILGGSKPEVRHRTEPAPKYEKNDAKPKYVPAPKAKPLSEKEREEKLKEMMEDAKVRKQDREKSLANHRKNQAQEETPKDYDDDFMRRQMSHLTSKGTMADRIKSNINNIQRSRSSMDSNFMRK